jgi:hypothetical protein
MLEVLVWLTAALCLGAFLFGYFKYRDVFHPLIILPPMCAFIYVYMPLHFIKTGDLFQFVSEDQAVFVQMLVIAVLGVFFAGCVGGSLERPIAFRPAPQPVNPYVLHKGAYILGGIGMLAWVYTIKNAGGFTGAFGQAYGAGWSDIGYIREAVYLLIVGLLLLISPEGLRIRDRKATIAIAAFAIPWLMQGLLGARRGPTFMITVAIVMSWYLARRKRPPVVAILGGGAALGLLMLFLVTNRNNIYLGSNFQGVKTDVSDVATKATNANEYIFGAGCIIASKETNHYYWGKRYLAELFVRPIPRQLWLNKYKDFGVGELEKNAGVAGQGLIDVLGWKEVPGAAAAMVADLWVEFSWLSIPVALLLGLLYGRAWRRAVDDGGFWTTEYTILILLSIYLVTQSGEAVIFRLVILSLPAAFVWRKARQSYVYEPPAPAKASKALEAR